MVVPKVHAFSGKFGGAKLYLGTGAATEREQCGASNRGDILGLALFRHSNDEPRLLDTITFLPRSFLPFSYTRFYLGNDIMADALCGPSNPLQTFQKQTSVDRTLQQDRFAARQQQEEVCCCLATNLIVLIDTTEFSIHRRCVYRSARR